MSVRGIQILLLIVTTGLLALPVSVPAQPSWQRTLQSMSQPDCQSVRVIGAVRVPSRFELQRPTRLTELLRLAGGLEAKVGKTIQVTHIGMDPVCAGTGATNQNSKSEMSEDFDLAEVARGEEKANPFMKPGDVVVVLGPDVVYVVGEVKTPQAVVLNNGMTLTRAVELSGGPREKSKHIRVRLVRTLAGVETHSNLVLTLKEIKNHRSEDPLLQAYDIIEVSDEKGSFGHGGHGTPLGPLVWTELPLQVVK